LGVVEYPYPISSIKADIWTGRFGFMYHYKGSSCAATICTYMQQFYPSGQAYYNEFEVYDGNGWVASDFEFLQNTYIVFYYNTPS